MPESSAGPHFDGASLVFQSGSDQEYLDATALISSLLVYTAKGDGSISRIETEKMLEMLSSRLGTGNAKAMEYLSSAAMRLADDQEIALRLRQISAGLSREEKEAVFSLVLEIAVADEELAAGEVESIVFAGQILGLPQDRIYTRLRSMATNQKRP